MAVTAARLGRVNPFAWISSREKLRAGLGRHRNRCLRNDSSLLHWYDKLIAANHVQTRASGKLDSARICSQSLQIRFQRLVYTAQHLDIRLHRRKLLRRDLNFRPCAHVYRHTHGESRQQNHSKNYP